MDEIYLWRYPTDELSNMANAGKSPSEGIDLRKQADASVRSKAVDSREANKPLPQAEIRWVITAYGCRDTVLTGDPG